MNDRAEGYRFTTVGDREARRVAATITGIRKRAQRRAAIDKVLTCAMYIASAAVSVVLIKLLLEAL